MNLSLSIDRFIQRFLNVPITSTGAKIINHDIPVLLFPPKALQRSRRMSSTEYHSQSTTPPLMLTCEYLCTHTDRHALITHDMSENTRIFKYVLLSTRISQWQS